MAIDQNKVMPGQTRPIKVFISYSHDSEDHKTRVKVLSDRLSQNGINCILDQYLDNGSNKRGWASWSDEKILGADYIFIVCTEGYYRRIQGLEKAVGRGAEWEFELILKLLYKDKSQYDRLIPVLFGKDDMQFIPERLSDLPHYCLDNEAEYEKLYGRIRGSIKNNSPCMEFDCWGKDQNELLLTQFGSEKLSRSSFQQKIQVHGEGHTFIERKSALDDLNKWLSQWGVKNNIFVLSGEEGDGKTWAVASWITEYIKYINKIPIVFLPARNLSSPAIEKILIESRSTRQKTRDVNFWEKKINDWKDRPYSNAPIVILVIDGINENLYFEWQCLLEQIQAEPWNKRIAVILTSRTKYWQDRFSQLEHLKTIQNWILPPYNDVELNEALERYDLKISDLPPVLHHLIRKPRYMDLVVKYRDKMAKSGDITVQRLIYEDFKDRVERFGNYRSLTNDSMKSIITGLAEKASSGNGLFTLKDFSELIPFVEKKEAIFEELKTGRVFIYDDLREDKFRVEPKRLAHGLGIILLDYLRNLSPLNSASIEENIACFLEPQPEMDFKVEIVAAAVFHIMKDGRLPEIIRYELLKYWIHSVNLPGDHLDDFPAYFPCSPQTYFSLTEKTLKMGRYDDMARSLLQYTFIKWAKKDKFQELFKKKFEEWMGYLNIYGIEKSGGGKESDKKEIQERLGFELNLGLASFLGFPFTLVEEYSDMILSNLALKVISYLDFRRPFIRAITIFLLARAVMGDPWNETIQWILRINREDIWPDVEREVLNLINKKNVEANEAASFLLWYEGSPNAFKLRQTIPKIPSINDYFLNKYEKDPCTSIYHWKREHYYQCLQRNDVNLFTLTSKIESFALEPGLPIPGAFRKRLPSIAKEIKPAFIWSSGLRREENFQFEQSEVALYAFSPETAAKIIKSVVRDAVNRDRSLLRFLSNKINKNYLILGNKEKAAIKKTCQILCDDNHIKESDDIGDQFFEFFLVDFTALEQLQSLIPRDKLYWHYDFFFKRLELSRWDEVLTMMSKTSETEMWRILWFISKYPKDIPKTVLKKIKELFTHPEKFTRRFALKIAWCSEDTELISTFINSSWTYSEKNDPTENHYGSLIIAKFCDQLPYNEIRDRIMPAYLPYAVFQRGMKKDEIEELSKDLKLVLEAGGKNRFIKDIVKNKPDMVKDWINSIPPSSPETDSKIERNWCFYNTLCGILLDVNQEKGVRLYRRLHQIRNYTGFIDEDTSIKILLYDTFRAEECKEIADLWDEIVDDCYKDIDILEIAIACQKVDKSYWFRRRIERYLESDLLFDKARGINMLGFLDLKESKEKLMALQEETPECWLRKVIEKSITRWNHNQWAREWFQRFLELENEVKAWAAFKLFLKCVDRRFWIWEDHFIKIFDRTPFFEKRKIFLELNRATIKETLKKNEEKLKKEFLGIEIDENIWPWKLTI